MAIQNGPSIVTSGLILCLDAADRNSYVSGSTTWRDLSSSSNNGTLTNGPTFDTTNGGRIYLDGTNDYIALNSSIASSSPFTLDFWYYPTRVNSSYDQIYSSPDNTDLQLFFHAVSKTLTTSIENVEIATSFTLSAGNINQWYNIVWTYNYVNRFVYVNNSVVQSNADTTAYTNNSATVAIGSLPAGTNYFLQGYLGSAKIYNRALSATEVLQNYNSTKTRFGL
jgi:hypothetical protein